MGLGDTAAAGTHRCFRMMASPILQVENLVKALRRKREAVRALVSVEEGEVFGLLGPDARGEDETVK